MRMVLLLLLVLTSTSFASVEDLCIVPLIPDNLKAFIKKNSSVIEPISPIPDSSPVYSEINTIPLNAIKKMLYEHADTLSVPLINTVLITIQCARERNIPANNILTIIDFSLPSNKKRLWIFDLQKQQLMFYTYVSHGLTSGALTANYFSNKFNDKASSIGLYITGDVYHGRHGLSLKLYGQDGSFNNNAYNRSIVMHAAWYVNDDFIQKYGRAGRSWGCPAVPENLIKPILELIKDNSLFVAYYPGTQWFLKSKFLTCENNSLADSTKNLEIMNEAPQDENRGEIFFVDRNNDYVHQESEPILVITADDYQRVFNTTAPLKRMLRRQINNMEYVALDNEELRSLDTNHDGVINELDNNTVNSIAFVVPNVINVGGNWLTEFRFVELGKIKEINLSSPNPTNSAQTYKIQFNNNAVMNLRTNNEFIRWLGL